MREKYEYIVTSDKSMNSIINEYKFDIDKLEHQVSVRSVMIKLAIHKTIDKHTMIYY